MPGQLPLLERYRDLLARPDEAFPLTLGEGGTPLVLAKRLGSELGLDALYLKFEGTNPTGSFKDRGMVLAVNRAVKGRFGRKSSFASPDETRAITGHEIGGVTVFGLPPALPVWIDAAVMERERVVLGGGSRRLKVIAPASILLTLPDAEVVEGLANPAPPRDETPPPA